MKKAILIPIIATLMLVLLVASAAAETEGDLADAVSDIGTDYFTIPNSGGGQQQQPYPSHTQTYTCCTEPCQLTVSLQDVGVNPAPTPPSWADDIANVYVDGVKIGTYDSLNNPKPAPGPGPVQSFTTGCLEAGQHTIKIELTYSWVSGSMFAKDITASPCGDCCWAILCEGPGVMEEAIDAKAMLMGFGYPADHIYLLTGTSATSANFASKINELSSKSDNINIYIYTHGHGAPTVLNCFTDGTSLTPTTMAGYLTQLDTKKQVVYIAQSCIDPEVECSSGAFINNIAPLISTNTNVVMVSSTTGDMVGWKGWAIDDWHPTLKAEDGWVEAAHAACPESCKLYMGDIICTNPDMVDLTPCDTKIDSKSNVVSSNDLGAEKNIFDLSENVYCRAENLPSNVWVDIYVVENKAWNVDDPIGTDVSSDGENTVLTDECGNIDPTKIWPAALEVNDYDIVVDVNQNGFLDVCEPVDDMTATQGFTAVPEFSTIAIPVASILGLLFLFSRRKRKE